MNVSWPAIIKLSTCDELIYLEGIDALNDFVDESYLPLDQTDYIIDSQGYKYSIEQSSLSVTCSFSQVVELHGLNDLVKLHYAQAGHCCISKIQIENADAAIAAIKDMPM